MSWVFVGTNFFHQKVPTLSIVGWELLRPILGAKNVYNTQGSTVFFLMVGLEKAIPVKKFDTNNLIHIMSRRIKQIPDSICCLLGLLA